MAGSFKILSFIFLCCPLAIKADFNIDSKSFKTEFYTGDNFEQMFLERNLILIAEKMNISISDAAIAQARLWDNPTLNFSNINLWKHREKEFSAELSQSIIISGKRSNIIKVEKISKEISIVKFEDLLLELKFELRKNIAELYYHQQYAEVIKSQINSLSAIINTYAILLEKGNISKGEIIRLKSELFEMESEMSDVQAYINRCERAIKDLISEDDNSNIEVTELSSNPVSPNTIDINDLISTAFELRADIKIMKLTAAQNKSIIDYEKSLRVPDLNVSAVYDRRGGVWSNFYGLGVGIDLPVFNRNQGAVKAATLLFKQSEKEYEQLRINVCNEIYESYANYCKRYDLYEKSLKSLFSDELDSMLEGYTRRLASRDISMVEYMDFLNSYRNTKQIILAAYKDAVIQYEELKYTLATNEL